MKQEINLPSYQILFGDAQECLAKVLQDMQVSNIQVLVDQETAQYCLPQLESAFHMFSPAILTVPAGEEHKSLGTCESIWNDLIRNQADRKSIMINLGGGVVGDMGGFCASTYMRGIPFIQIPTTLLAQVDASVGGKVGIDYAEIKNLIGNFCDPHCVIIDPTFLETLPPREIRSGFAEIIKHALIRDQQLWTDLRKGKSVIPSDWNSLIYTSVCIKRDVVISDPYEKGLRKILNFGHTIGHAVESVMLPSEHKLLHGEAIAIGMIAEAYISNQQSSLPEDQLADISQYLLQVFEKVTIPTDSSEQLLARMMHDKKNEGGAINCTLLREIGRAEVNYQIAPELIQESLDYYRSL